MPRYRRFSEASVSEKILDSLFLATIGLGYIFAMVHLLFSHQGRDGQPGLSVEDIRIAYYGEHQQTRLGAAINGPMSGNFSQDGQKKIVIDWVDQGAKKDTFEAEILPIFQQNCNFCHSKSSAMGLPSLETYDDVIKLTDTDTGASIQSLVRVSHIHFFGIAFILFLVGRLFILCEMRPWLKRMTVVVPFLAMFADILSWYVTKIIPGFAIVVVISGALMGLSLAAQIVISLYQMWFVDKKITSVTS